VVIALPELQSITCWMEYSLDIELPVLSIFS